MRMSARPRAAFRCVDPEQMRSGMDRGSILLPHQALGRRDGDSRNRFRVPKASR